jgi:hypothetical protein
MQEHSWEDTCSVYVLIASNGKLPAIHAESHKRIFQAQAKAIVDPSAVTFTGHAPQREIFLCA